MKRFTSIRFSALILAFALPLQGAEPDGAGIEFYEKKVRPILVEHCYSCHSATAAKIKGGLRVDAREALFEGGESGKVLIAGHPEKSKFIEAVTYKNVELQMPKSGKLPDTVIVDLTAWVKMGAPMPPDSQATSVGKAAFDLEKRKRTHWAWKPILAPRVPVVENAEWPLTSIDRFILAQLESKKIAPAKPAEPRTLLRRIYFDLIGLPPTPEQIKEFVEAYAIEPRRTLERTVDRLLEAPRFGERWARHWLDLVRYGESRGHEFDPTLPNAWQYRDYVIRALNADVPYNQFVTEHIAGDLMPKPRLNKEEGFNESILGTGFWFLGEEVHSPVDIRGDEADRYDNRIDVFSKTFLGLTVSCARCHDHKFDAITTKDYYALYGFLRSSNYRLVRFDSLEQNKRVLADLTKLRAQAKKLLLKTYAVAMNAGLDRTADYLLAARDALAGADSVNAKPRGRVGVDHIVLTNRSDDQQTPPSQIDSPSERVDRIAAERKLDSKCLAYWVLYLQRAAKDPKDPLHGWAKLIQGDKAKRQYVETLQKQSAIAAIINSDSEIVFDFANSRPEDFRPDDSTFGAGPMRPGDVRFSNDADRPIAKVYDYAAAEKDPAFSGLKLVPDAQLDAGSLGYQRAGNTICTPSFTISSEKVFYLVRGAGKAYASVDGHVMIAGPLHGALVRGFNVGQSFQWVQHDLSAYVGHRVHFEFTADTPDFAVSMIARGNAPPKRAQRLAAWLLKAFEKDQAKDVAAAHQRQLQHVAGLMAKNDLSNADVAQLADWMIRNQELFGVEENVIAQASRQFMEEQAKLVKQIKMDSRLALAVQDGSPEDETVFIRGSHKAPGEVVPRRLLESLAGTKPIAAKTGSGRLELAKQVTDPSVNPFVTRVMVNRVWHHLFGRGIVGSTDNFGVLGERPTHPELLDHLAGEFAGNGWSVKRLIRTLVLSRTYQMSSHPDETADASDPENLLLHRARLRRLEGEAIRDAMLSISGRLNPKMYGPSVLVHLTPFLDGRGRPGSGPHDGDGRRSVYIAVRRNFLSPMMLAFDTPSPFSTVGRRTVSNVPAQALIMMNDPFVHLMAERWAQNLAAGRESAKEKIGRMYQSAYARTPTDTELRDCLSFLEAQARSAPKGMDDVKVWKDLAHVVFNVKEFIFIE